MFPDNFLILPQSYSNSLLSETQRKKFTKILIKNKLNLIIFSGVPDYSFNWLREFHNLKIKTGIIFHGGLSELNGNPEKQKNFQKIVLFSKNGIINRIGVVKEGLDYWFESVTQSKIYRVLPINQLPSNLKKSEKYDHKVHIGIFGNSTSNKNRHTQVIAASLIENSIIHILEPNEFDYAISKSRLQIHSNLTRNSFLELLGSMDINLYCSFSESWGQVVLESISLKTPCLFSNNSGIDKWIGKDFLVEEYDNPKSIADTIKKVLKLREFPVSNNTLDNISKKICKLNDAFLET